MNTDPHADLFCDRNDLLDEIGVMLPDLFLREDAAVRERLPPRLVHPGTSLVRACQVEFPGLGPSDFGAAAAPDSIAHMSIRRVVHARVAQAAQILLVVRDLGITPRE